MGSKPDLSVQIGKKTLRNHLILASGGLGRTARGLIHFAEAGCAAVISKTITPEPWEGNPSPRILEVGELDLINCEGLPNLGREAFISEIKKAKASIKDCLVVPNLTGNTVEDFVRTAVDFEQSGADCLEVSLFGCRNFQPGTHIAASYWAQTPERIYEVVKAVHEKVSIPIWVKGAQGQNLVAKVKAAEEAGADAIIARGDGTMALPIDPITGKPILGHPHAIGHLTGPLSKWDGLRVVADVCRSVKVPVIAGGGVYAGIDVIEYMMMGACAVQLITAYHRKGPRINKKILTEIEEFLSRQGYNSIRQVIGMTLKSLPTEPYEREKVA